MDLSKLLTSGPPVQQTNDAKSVDFVAQQHGQHPAARLQHSYGQPERSASFARQPSGHFNQGAAPLQPPALTPIGGGQPQQYSSQSPVSSYSQHASPYSAHHHSYQGRPTSHGLDRHPATPSQPHIGTFAQPNATSPTPSSQHSHTPQSVQHSPMPALQHGVAGQYAQQSIPYGAPPRSMSGHYHEAQSSPQHHRGSLAPPLPHRSSTDIHTTQSPSKSDYRSYGEREHSVDVSPRSMPKTHPPSLGSRKNSSHDEMSAPPQQPSISHVYPNVTPQQSVASHSRRSSTNTSSVGFVQASPVVAHISTSALSDRQPLRRSHTMDMAHLLTPSTEQPPPLPQASTKQQEETAKPQINGIDGAEQPHESKKRGPESEMSPARPLKKERMRRHLERPVWAQLSSKNPRFAGGPAQNSASRAQNGVAKPPQARSSQSTQSAKSAQTAQTAQSAQPPSSKPAQQNGQVNFFHPWLNPLPYDMDLINAREVLGPWEKSIRWNTPYPDMLRAVQDWLMHNMQLYQDITQDPSSGTIEIEGKIGRLVRASNGQPAGLPVMNMTLLDPAVNRDYRFESELEETDFKVLNNFLNQTLMESNQPGRQRIEYKRVLEIDSFAHLSTAALAALPKSVHKQTLHGRELKLRSTQDVKTKQFIARIIKVPLADLHIFNPSGYDCRISMNAEVNVMRPDLNFDDLVTPATESKPVPPSRRKDRLSYKHLAYQIDLTNVQVIGLAPKHEMEIEVDAQALSSQIKLMAEQKPHAFTDVVSGFLDNATFLMRQQQPGK